MKVAGKKPQVPSWVVNVGLETVNLLALVGLYVFGFGRDWAGTFELYFCGAICFLMLPRYCFQTKSPLGPDRFVLEYAKGLLESQYRNCPLSA